MPQEITATNPTTGETVVYRNGEWVPYDGEPAPVAAPTATNPQTGETVVLENGEWIPLSEAGDNGIYPTMGERGTEANPYDLNAITPEEALQLRKGMWVRNGDQVYALPADPERGPQRIGDVRTDQGIIVRPQDTNQLADVGRGLWSGIQEGAAGLVGLPRALEDFGTSAGDFALRKVLGDDALAFVERGRAAGEQYREDNRLANIGALPSAEGVLDARAALVGGPTYQPQTTAGEYANTIGEFLPNAAVPGGVIRKAASVLVPGVLSEAGGQIGERLDQQSETGPDVEPWLRLAGGVVGGVGTGIRLGGGAERVVRNATGNVDQAALDMAAALRARSPVPLTNAEALQQVTGGATGMGRVQRIAEGASQGLGPMMAQRPQATQQALADVLNQIGPEVAPSNVAGRAQESASGVLDTMRRRVNDSAEPFYDRLPGQSLPPEQYARLAENPSYALALDAVRNNPEIAPLLQAELPMDQATRMLRAQQQGFTVPAFHETTPEGLAGITAEGFSLVPRQAGAGDFQMPIGVFTKPTGQSIGVGGDRAVQMPLLIRAPQTQTFADRAELSQLLRQNPDYGAAVNRLEDTNAVFGRLGKLADEAWDRTRNTPEGDVVDAMDNDLMRLWKSSEIGAGEEARQAATADLRARGLDAITVRSDRGTGGRDVATTVVFDPENVRSRFDPFAAPTPDNDLNVINRVIQQLDTMETQARPGVMNPQGNNTLAAQRETAAGLARALASEVSPDFATARQTVATGREAFVEPLRRGPIGAIANQSDVTPNLGGQTQALFPTQPFEGQAAETARALRLMGETDPNIARDLTRQFLAREGAEAMQSNVGGPNQFGGAGFAARVAGNPLQEQTLMQAVDVAAPSASPDFRNLMEGLRATGQRHRAGSETAFNQEILGDLRGGNVGANAISLLNPTQIPARVGRALDDWTARRNADRLSEILMSDPEEFARIVQRANQGNAQGLRFATALAASGER